MPDAGSWEWVAPGVGITVALGADTASTLVPCAQAPWDGGGYAYHGAIPGSRADPPRVTGS